MSDTIQTLYIQLTREQVAVLREEMELAEREEPGALARFRAAMHEGRVASDAYVIYPEETDDELIVSPCGCFYGWAAHLDYDRARSLEQRILREMNGSKWYHSDIELFLMKNGVSAGDTPTTDSRGGNALFILDMLIESIPPRG